MEAVANSAISPVENASSYDDSFSVIPRNCDTAVVYWDLTSERQPIHSKTRLCLQINGIDSDAEEMIILHRESGHFIVPLLAEDRNYRIALGWSDSSGFRAIFEQSIKLPNYPVSDEGALSSSLSFRGHHFWPKGYGTSVN